MTDSRRHTIIFTNGTMYQSTEPCYLTKDGTLLVYKSEANWSRYEVIEDNTTEGWVKLGRCLSVDYHPNGISHLLAEGR
jgi:hypothetical protein